MLVMFWNLSIVNLMITGQTNKVAGITTAYRILFLYDIYKKMFCDFKMWSV